MEKPAWLKKNASVKTKVQHGKFPPGARGTVVEVDGTPDGCATVRLADGTHVISYGDLKKA